MNQMFKNNNNEILRQTDARKGTENETIPGNIGQTERTHLKLHLYVNSLFKFINLYITQN